MRKLLCVLPILLIMSIAFGGGMVENTNQSAEQIRMMARGASTDLDAVFFNPAGLTKLDNGMHLYLSSQTITQTRTITSDVASLNSNTFEGTTFAPVFPNFYFAYKMDKLVLSAGFVPIGGGGSAIFDKGLPSFEAPASVIPSSLSAAGIPTTAYSTDVEFNGSSTYLGGTASASYAINDMISVSVGAHFFSASNTYEGHLKDIMINPNYPAAGADGTMRSATAFFTTMATLLTGGAAQATGGAAALAPLIAGGAGDVSFANLVLGGSLPQANVDAIAAGFTALGVPGFNAATWTPNIASGAYTAAAAGYTANAAAMTANATATQDIEVDAKQTGTGFAPVLGLNISLMDKLNIGIRYEGKAALELTNETTVDGSGLFTDGDVTNADMPAMLGIGLSYRVIPALNIALDYNLYMNTGVDWDGKEVNVEDGNEIAVGVEFALSNSLLLSGG
ncbi:MAG: aromatic hydrocarbon degradation protein, partial [Candidatus Marinimicrobia bacterium]|nr:aromatic hydrocarbon degradation protein [Candidatus Neomarinimicrobiota bacterium]